METHTILVTGGAGFIGTNLVNELQKRGHSVFAADLYNTDRENYVRADVRNYRQVEKLCAGEEFDYVYHLSRSRGSAEAGFTEGRRQDRDFFVQATSTMDTRKRQTILSRKNQRGCVVKVRVKRRA